MQWRNAFTVSFRVRFRVRNRVRVTGSGFDYCRHCAIFIAPNTESLAMKFDPLGARVEVELDSKEWREDGRLPPSGEDSLNTV